MDVREAFELLTLASARDGRTVSAEVAAVWADDLSDVAAVDAMAATREHFRTSTDWLMPAHVLRIVRARRRELLPPTDGTIPAHVHRWLRDGTCTYPGCIDRIEAA